MSDLFASVADVAVSLLGNPNAKLSRPRKGVLRFGTHGSLVLNLARGVYFDHEEGHGGGLVDLVVREKKVSRGEAYLWLKENRFTSQPEHTAPITTDADTTERTAFALALWRQAKDLRGSPGWRYLERRDVDLGALPDHVVDDALRWHPAAPWAGGLCPAIIGRLTDALSGEPCAVHVTAIAPDGAKLGKRMYGPRTGCVLRLWPDDTLYRSLAVAEGIETALVCASARRRPSAQLCHGISIRMLVRPVWVAGCADNLARLPVLPGIQQLTILADHDEAGLRAAVACADRWVAAGRNVEILHPHEPGKDFADPPPDYEDWFHVMTAAEMEPWRSEPGPMVDDTLMLQEQLDLADAPIAISTPPEAPEEPPGEPPDPATLMLQDEPELALEPPALPVAEPPAQPDPSAGASVEPVPELVAPESRLTWLDQVFATRPRKAEWFAVAFALSQDVTDTSLTSSPGPSYRRLADQADVAPNTVTQAVRWLRDHGHLNIAEPAVRNEAPTYHLTSGRAP